MFSTLPAQIHVQPIPAFNDNYIWCMHDTDFALVVDPGDAKPVLDYLHAHKLKLCAILVTHHHQDHTGGIAQLIAYYPDVPVVGFSGSKVNLINHKVNEGDSVSIDKLGCKFDVLEVPGHTLDHIAFVGHGCLFCGDTLFSAGCGRLFEGTPAQMHASLSKFAALPGDTKVFCTHEYTLANLAFADAVEGSNQDLQNYTTWAKQQREQDLPTLPSTISEQLAINPFLRCAETTVASSVNSYAAQELSTTVDVFTELRKWKDAF